MALIKDDHAMFVEHFMPFVFGHKVVQLLNGGDDDFVLMKTAFFIPVQNRNRRKQATALSLLHSGQTATIK